MAEDGRIESIDLKIFDRWGNLLSVGTEWDGSNADPGVYVYLIDVLFADGTEKVFAGDLILVE